MAKSAGQAAGPPAATEYLALSDDALLHQCEVKVHRSSGPGGQHRNKVSTAIRLYHRPSGITAQGCDSRSQRQNKLTALRRLRLKIACQVRRPVALEGYRPPEMLSSCLFSPRGGRAGCGCRKNGRCPQGLL